ncbi:(2Fe-2S)-binding protein [Emcibacter sp.]|uniref:(2Fe-2S)-binding protein n=1 Tax=Emcibacter sp. TaxID=1979954 RepID=UPI002AA7ABEF|nr:(2Fe-2S)-binding protein [Emcibacter sp.]
MTKFKLNGETRTFDGDGEMPLLWYLRDEAGLTGTKYSCGVGQCGACTVHVNGEAVRSCLTFMDDVEGEEITTIEGLSETGDHPLQKAWAEHDVPQCGYCQSGQIMQAAALIAENPDPSEQEIIDGMNGNLCRCGTYQRIRKAIKSAAESAGGASK